MTFGSSDAVAQKFIGLCERGANFDIDIAVENLA
jgi:hypothetical protein